MQAEVPLGLIYLHLLLASPLSTQRNDLPDSLIPTEARVETSRAIDMAIQMDLQLASLPVVIPESAESVEKLCSDSLSVLWEVHFIWNVSSVK